MRLRFARAVWRRLWRRYRGWWVAVAALALLALVPLPFYLFLPGSAEPVEPTVSVEGGHKDERGKFLLTTVYSFPASNIYVLAYGLLRGSEIEPKERATYGLDDAAYEALMKEMMEGSQNSAVVAALRFVGKPVQVVQKGVEVKGILPNSRVQGLLRVGDVITGVDGRPVFNQEELVRELRGRAPGQSVRLEVQREGRSVSIEVPLVALSSDSSREAPQTGLGIQAVTVQRVESPVRVSFHTGNIGGPSAGLMFALEIVNQLTPGDLTKGHLIAGTGTIDVWGRVGRIGGVRHKVVAAHRAGAEVFFVPVDNEPDAADAARSLGTSMRIVPVRTLEEAVHFLQSMPDA
ncbi:MAG: SepM family pheromone-processing serine protease [Alicyclobacillaceae bacterium]|nr:SepM family pheromone-processing serine protease [Alicyclobacillaceae bacterium]